MGVIMTTVQEMKRSKPTSCLHLQAQQHAASVASLTEQLTSVRAELESAEDVYAQVADYKQQIDVLQVGWEAGRGGGPIIRRRFPGHVVCLLYSAMLTRTT